MQTPREILTPLIRARGIRATARDLGMVHPELINYMNGSRGLPTEKLERLAALFGYVYERKIIETLRRA